MKTIAVFCAGGYSESKEQYYKDLAYSLGSHLANQKFRVVSGAGLGLEREILRGAYEAGGHTIGLVLNRPGRTLCPHMTEHHIFDRLSKRQSAMLEKADGFIALPGGFGTLYEIFNVLALKRAEEIPLSKPLVLIGDHYKSLNTIFEKMTQEGFINKSVEEYLCRVQTVDEAVEYLSAHML